MGPSSIFNNQFQMWSLLWTNVDTECAPHGAHSKSTPMEENMAHKESPQMSTYVSGLVHAGGDS